MRLSDLVRQRREERRWTKVELARQAGVDKSVVTRLESGARIGRADTIARITQVLGISSTELQAALAEASGVESERDLQLLDLSKVPLRERARLRRAILDLVRNFEEDQNEAG